MTKTTLKLIRDSDLSAKAALVKIDKLRIELGIPDTNPTWSEARMFLRDAIYGMPRCACGRVTDRACSKCMSDLGCAVYVCERGECRARHKREQCTATWNRRKKGEGVDLRFDPNAVIEVYYRDGTTEQIPVQCEMRDGRIVSGPCYTKREWESGIAADWEYDDAYGLMWQGRPGGPYNFAEYAIRVV